MRRGLLASVALALTLGPLALVAPVAATAASAPARMAESLDPAGRTGANFPARSVPAYVGSHGLVARVAAGSGPVDARYRAPRGTGTVVLGDWDGNGTVTPARFVDGTWRLWETLLGYRAQPQREATFGQAGDQPVAGDWDGDGRTDLGVFRAGRWYLAQGSTDDGTGAVPLRSSFSYGRAGDLPLAGDWDGDGVTGVGVRRAGEWYVRQRPSGGASSRILTWGSATRLPVVGDWDGDGADDIGLVSGDAWQLRQGLGAAAPASRVTVAGGSGLTPVAWRTRAGATAAGCPTARAGLRGVGKRVVPSTLLDRSFRLDASTTKLRSSLRRAERFVLGAYYSERWAATSSSAYTQILSRQRSVELAVRGPAMTAVTVAVAARTGAHSSAVTGRSRAEAVQYVDWLVRSLACEHQSVSPGGWGAEWQADHWANLVGLAAWLVWDRLTPQTRGYVAAMLSSQADARTEQPVAYWATRDGVVQTPGNTQAEEDSWRAGLLELAVDMMPGAPHAAAWRSASVQLAVAAYATSADVTSAATVNGVALSSRLDGYNAYPDHTVENHGRIHPDYASNIQHLWWAADFAGLAGRSVPEAMLHNAQATYDAFSTVDYVAGGASPAGGSYLPPGGTVYRPDTSGIYYPQGNDWGLVRRAPFVSFDAHALAWLPGSFSWSPREAFAKHLYGQRRLAATSGTDDGRTYSVNPAVAATQDTYPGREEYAAQQLATAWLALYVHALRPVRVDDSLVPLPVGGAGRGTSPERHHPHSP